MDLGFATVAGITVICYLFAEIVKATPLDNKWLPIIVGACGGLLGIVALYVMPDFPADNFIDSIAVGIVSGLASTGANQIIKQLTDIDEEEL